MRSTFIDELTLLARFNPQIALIVGDLGYNVIEPFAEEFPDRFINAGVAEQNMTGLAAGMASEGYHVFTYSIANFPTFRCAEQIRNDVDYHNLPVTIVSVGGGVAYGNLGYSHHAVQDYALMRIMPNMLIGSPGDPHEVRACLRYLVQNPQPSYLRLGKNGEKNFNNEIPNIKVGVWNKIREGNKLDCILTTGTALQYVDKYTKNQSIYTLPLWGMKERAFTNKKLDLLQNLTVIEEHILDGGFSSWVLECGLKNIKSSNVRSICLQIGCTDVVANGNTLIDKFLKMI